MRAKSFLKKYVRVTWLDAHGPTDEFVREAEVKFEPATVVTVGYLVVDCPDGVVLSQTRTSDGFVRGNMTIMRANIVKVEGL